MSKTIQNIAKKWYVVEEKEGELIMTLLDALSDKAFTIKTQHKGRTIAQNRALHMYCKKVADALNDAGFTVQKFLRRKSEKRIESEFNKLIEDLGMSVSQQDLQKIINAKQECLSHQDLELDWKMESVKDIIWRNIQLAIFKDKPSTTQLESEDITQIYKAMDNYLSKNIGLESIDFPSEESMIFEQNYKGV